MQDIATTLRTLQLYAHNAHNLSKGATFLADHPFLGDLYESYEEEYDSVVERAIGEDLGIDLLKLQLEASRGAKAKIVDAEDAFTTILTMEKELCGLIAKAVDGASDGTQNLLQGIADNSLTRQYKIQQRLK